MKTLADIARILVSDIIFERIQYNTGTTLITTKIAYNMIMKGEY